MTIPSRSAPPIPPQSLPSSSATTGTRSQTTSSSLSRRDSNSTHADAMSAWSQQMYNTPTETSDGYDPQKHRLQRTSVIRKKPPRPPPPQMQPAGGVQQQHYGTTSTAHQQPKNIGALTNIFRRMKTNDNRSKDLFTLPPPPKAANSHKQYGTSNNHQPSAQHHNNSESIAAGGAATAAGTIELISFDSPPNSPTPTQKSSSSWNSSLIFSSDLATMSASTGSGINWTTPMHEQRPLGGGAGSTSTTHSESGFEDDFGSQATFDPFSPEMGVMPAFGPATTVFGASAPAASSNTNNNTKSNSSFWTSDFLDPLCNGKSLLPPEPVITMPTIIRPMLKTNTNNASSASSRSGTNHRTVAGAAVTGVQLKPEKARKKAVANSGNMNRHSYAVVLYQFDALQEGDLNLIPTEKITLLRQINDDWFYGRSERGDEGMLPVSYVDIKVPLSTAAPVHENSPPPPMTAAPSLNVASTTATQPSTSDGRAARALYTFNAQTADDLTILEHEPVKVLYAINDEWLYGETSIGQRGQFPVAYVELL